MTTLVCECGTCATCKSRERQRAYRDDPAAAERLRANDRRRYQRNREARLAAQKQYKTTPEGREAHTRGNREWRQRNREKVAAHSVVARAIRSGRLVKQVCEVCGDPDTSGHHDDYSKPLDVRWLCDRHHKAEHYG
jgi:hypothetical protein